ncbi:lysosomal acid phosphatase [Leptinotarsa decemlineata]|uniref:lysosomal acid phosphatase n=1 Tax=Leptinotarsa decemlineata TaxID=7539 RepID=UPI003D309249
MLVEMLVFLVTLTTPIFATSTLISVVQVFRHGQRTATNHYSNDPYSSSEYWPVGPGQLTNTGKTQHFRLGQYTRERYNATLPRAYASDYFYVQTTEVDRTHMSAQCNFLGLFPPTAAEQWNPDIAWSPIPIHPLDSNILSPLPLCKAYFEEQSRVLNNESYYKDIDKKYADLYDYLTIHSGDNVTSLSGVGSIFDSLFIENEFGYTLPSWTDAVFPEPITTLAGYSFQSSGYTTKLARLSAGTFLKEVIEHFEKMQQNTTSAHFFRMYSGHDFNIVQILSALGAYEPHVPYFASTIYFELWKSFLGTYHVNIYYKQKDVIKKITPKGCLQFDCNLSHLKKELHDVLIDSKTKAEECNL